MTNNLDDFDQPEMEPNGGGLPPPQGMRANLTEAWRTRPLFKLFVLMALVGAVIAVSITLFSSGPPTEASHLFRPPKGLSQPPGGSSSPYFIEQTNEATKNREQTALNNGGSALPTPIGSPTNLDETAAGNKNKDPLVELRAETEHLKQQLAQVQQQQQQQSPKPPEQFDESLARAMQKEMDKLMGGWEPRGVKDVTVTKAEEENKDQSAANNAAAANATARTSPGPRIIVPAGTVSYAQLLTEANSDVPGPILVQILSGPLAGARAVGAFKVTQDPYLILTFTLADLKGKDYQINALALDPDTTLGGMATDVDERYFTRILLPAAAGFMQGFGSALGQGSSSLVTNGTTTIVQQSSKGISEGAFQGLAQAGQSMGQFFQNQANQTQPLVRVAAGTPMGLFFVTSVKDMSDQQQAYPFGQPGMPGYPGMYPGYPNGGYPNYGAMSPQGYYPGMNAGYGGLAGQTPIAATTSVVGSAASNAPYPNATAPYTSMNTAPMQTYNYGINNVTGLTPNTSGVGTTAIVH
jgi:intracellular multiplication protein IcmE